MEKARSLASETLAEPDLAKVLFLQPEQLLYLFDEEAAGREGKEERVKGYKVKVRYQPVQEADKKTKRQAITQVFLKSFRRDTKEKPD